MRDPRIIQAYTDRATGIELECIMTDDGRAIWGAWHPAYMGKPAMAVGDTDDIALKRLLNRRPELARKEAA